MFRAASEQSRAVTNMSMYNGEEHVRADNSMRRRKGLIAVPGAKARFAHKGAYGSEHVYRNPTSRPTAQEILSDSFTTTSSTRSKIADLADRPSLCTSIGASRDDAVRQCKVAVDSIVQQAHQHRKKFFDRSWHLGERNTLYPAGTPETCSVSEPTQVIRLQELLPKVPLFDGSRAVIKQGALGNGYLVGAMNALGNTVLATGLSTEIPVTRLLAAHDAQVGVYGVVLFINGAWEWVIVDDFIAVEGRQPLYASCTTQLWPMVLEKAYAKAHQCWDTIDGGWEHEALVTLTGGMHLKASLEGMSFQQLQNFSNAGNKPSVALFLARKSIDTKLGLRRGAAYGVLGIHTTREGAEFVLVQNFWGKHGAWRGAFGVDAPEWVQYPSITQELGNVTDTERDGAFWMLWKNFQACFTDIDVCELHDPRNNVVSLYNRSKRNPVCPDQTYVMEVLGAARIPLTLTLVQEDPKVQPDHAKAKRQPYAMIRLSVYRLSRIPDRYADLQSHLQERLETKRNYGRQVDHILDLEPGAYSIIAELRDSEIDVDYIVRVSIPHGCNGNVSLFRLDNRDGTFLSTDARLNDEMRGRGSNYGSPMPQATQSLSRSRLSFNSPSVNQQQPNGGTFSPTPTKIGPPFRENKPLPVGHQPRPMESPFVTRGHQHQSPTPTEQPFMASNGRTGNTPTNNGHRGSFNGSSTPGYGGARTPQAAPWEQSPSVQRRASNESSMPRGPRPKRGLW